MVQVQAEEVLLSRTLTRVFANVKTLFRDRGYKLERAPKDELVASHIMTCIKNGEPVLKGFQLNQCTLAFLTDVKRLPIHQFRDILETTNTYMETQPETMNCVVLIVCKEGTTPATGSEMSSYKGRIVFESWTHSELLHNLPRHELSPEYIPLSPRSKEQVLTKYMVKEEHLMHMSRSDPAAKYYAFKPGTVIQINRKFGMTTPTTVYRLVK